MILLLLLLQSAAGHAQTTLSAPDSLLVMFWNLENFFEPGSPQASSYWTAKRFNAKCDGIAKTVLEVADCYGKLPDAIAFAEVENAKVLRKLIYNTALHKLDYAIVHYDSPDHRGIDCALLYRKGSLRLTDSFPRHLTDSSGSTIATRDILAARFGPLAILVNHHPSKLGDGASERRRTAVQTMNFLADSLIAAGTRGVLAVGDFNDTLWGDVEGSLKYNGNWERIDGGFAFGELEFEDMVFCPASLQESDRTHGGMKPRRTFVGPKYNGGISDHFPIIFRIFTTWTIK